MSQIKRPGEVSGEFGLLAAVIARAAEDATSPRAGPETRADARAFFAGPVYEDYVTWLGLPAEALPVQILGAINGKEDNG